MTAPMAVRTGEPLGRHTSLKVGGPAEYFAEARGAAELAELLGWAEDRALPARVIGGGSNLLVADRGAGGLVVKSAGTAGRVIERDGQPVLLADAGATLANVARRLSKQGYGGLEWATNVPGTIGGAVVNNAGAFGGDTASHLLAATVVNAAGTVRRLAPADLDYGYRTSRLKRRELGVLAVVEAELRLARSAPAASQARVAEFQRQRTSSQPRQLSAGSVFANPPGDFSARLIQEAGLKGTRIGGAEISTQHANFIVNVGQATAADVYALVRLAQQQVYQRFGTWLRPEIELFGRWTDTEQITLMGPSS